MKSRFVAVDAPRAVLSGGVSLRSRLAEIPEGTAALFFIQIFATLGFAVLYSTLVLYATKHLHFSVKEAAAIMGVFGAFNYGLHMFGGYLGGRFLSNRNLFVGGMVLQVIGCWLISHGTAASMYWGLALFLTGSGLNVTCINMMLTQRFAPEDERRESAFLWNYAGMNIGFFIGFTVAGHYQETERYSQLFIFATGGNFIAILLALANWKRVADLDTPLLKATAAEFRWRLAAGVLILHRGAAAGVGDAAAHRADGVDRRGGERGGVPRAHVADVRASGPARAAQHVGLPHPHAGFARVLVAVPDGAERVAAVRGQ